MTKEERAAQAAAKRAAAAADEGLVRMTKGDESLDVHPSCVAAHERAGWTAQQ